MTQTVKPLSTMWETWVQSLGQEDPLEKEMAIHSSTLAWKIPWTEEPGGLQSLGHKELDRTEQLTLQCAKMLYFKVCQSWQPFMKGWWGCAGRRGCWLVVVCFQKSTGKPSLCLSRFNSAFPKLQWLIRDANHIPCLSCPHPFKTHLKTGHFFSVECLENF